jgi:hypothetical protein
MSDDLREPHNDFNNTPMWFNVCLALAILVLIMLGWHLWPHG